MRPMSSTNMPSASLSRIHSIPLGAHFADQLVAGFMARVEDADCMAPAMILLPNRRLMRAVRLAFLRHSGGRAQILPRLLAIGDIDADDADLVLAGWDAGDLPPVIDPLERQILLASLVRQFRASQGEKDLSETENFGLARALGTFLDQLQTNGVDFASLSDLVGDELAEHWQKILQFLKILTENWPHVLKERGKSDTAFWRDATIRARAEAWRAAPPQDLVVIAGSTGSVPATRELMKTVLTLPQGHLVLPGLDGAMEAEEWEALTEQAGAEQDDQTLAMHPQFQLAHLLKGLDAVRENVRPWVEGTTGNPARERLLREVMRLTSYSQKWYDLRAAPLPREAIDGVEMAICHDRREEARIIALAMREALEQPTRTASLITGDQALGEMVSLELARLGVDVPSSAGARLANTRRGQFLRLLAEAWGDDFAPASLLALGQHPDACGGMPRLKFRTQMRLLERRVLRCRQGGRQDGNQGGYQGGGLKILRACAAKIAPELVDFIDEAWLKTCGDLSALRQGDLGVLADAHALAAEHLSSDDMDANKVWCGRDGNRLAGIFAGLGRFGGGVHVDAAQYPKLLEECIAEEVLYADEDLHPRLSIMGLMEARMQVSDVMILGGMNEGITPPQALADPWMSQSMRAGLGLPTAFWRVGMVAHDVMLAMGAARILLTRARYDGDTPTEPSRWWRRLEAVLAASNLEAPYHTRLVELDRGRLTAPAAITPPSRPAPTISVEERTALMSKFSATQLETLMRDPYAIYARRVLGLRALEPIRPAPSPALKGTIYHRAIHGFMCDHGKGDLPEDALDRLLAQGARELDVLERTPWIRLFWELRFARIAGWFINHENAMRDNLEKSFSEIKGTAVFTIGKHDITLTAEADRIDLMRDGSLIIADYKTGTIPNHGMVERAINCQLVVEAMIARAGGFAEITAIPENIALRYWKLSGTASAPAKIEPRLEKEVGLDDVMALVEARLGEVMEADWAFISEAHPHPHHRYSDYRHLARVAEWGISGDAGGDEEGSDGTS